MCGALTTSSPRAVKMAQLKSSRSLTFTLLAVLRSVTPICSAMPANKLLNTSRKTGSGAADTLVFAKAGEPPESGDAVEPAPEPAPSKED